MTNEQAHNLARGIAAALFKSGIRVVANPAAITYKAMIHDTAGKIVDYRGVTIRGYLSTWQHITPADRDGDYVVKGAFTETIPHFMQNPVLLTNHRNAVDAIAGKFTLMREDDTGLYIEAKISDSPTEFGQHIRVCIVERNLRALSMGGWFQYGEDGRGIVNVRLHEGSLVAVPSNPDALITT